MKLNEYLDEQISQLECQFQDEEVKKKIEMIKSFKRDDLIENICKSLEVYQKKDGYIRMELALRIIRSFKLK